MMFCPNCGTQLPDDSNFCLKCGQALHAGEHPSGETPKWEMCEIEYAVVRTAMIGKSEFKFWAKATGPNGTHNAGESPVFKGGRDWPTRENGDMLNILIAKLMKDGWEPVGQGRAWYNERFRKPAK